MVFNKNNKGVVDKVFVYVFSIIIIGFAGFLVTKFVIAFTDDTEDRFQAEFYEKFEKDFNGVYKTYGAEKVNKYKVNDDVKFVCFIPSVDCIDSIEDISSEINNYDLDSLMTLINAGDNIIMYDEDDVMNSKNIGVFNPDNNCFCAKPNLGRFDLIFENRKNQVYISGSE